TLLHLQRYVDAVASYEATEELAPGWFHCRTDLWLAQQLVLGNLDHETLLPLHILEDGPMPPEEKVRLAEQALVRTPQLALLHLLRGKNLARLGRPWEAEEAYRQGLACSAEPDVKTRLNVTNYRSESHHPSRVRCRRHRTRPPSRRPAREVFARKIRASHDRANDPGRSQAR